MSVNSERPQDPAADRAASLMRELGSHKTDAPHLAEPSERAIARLIDLVVWFVLGSVISIIPYVIYQWFFVDAEDKRPNQFGVSEAPALPSEVEWAAFLATILVVAAYEVIPTARTGQHFAKSRMRLRVVGRDGGVPGYRAALIHWGAWWLPLAAAFSFFGLTFGTGWGLLAIAFQAGALLIPGSIFWVSDARGYHDRLAGTSVLSDH